MVICLIPGRFLAFSTRRPARLLFSNPFGGILEPSGGVLEASGRAKFAP